MCFIYILCEKTKKNPHRLKMEGDQHSFKRMFLVVLSGSIILRGEGECAQNNGAAGNGGMTSMNN